MSTLYQDLKAIREKQRMTILDVYERTRITEENIRLIESGEMFTREDVNKIYMRSFTRTYGRAVGISDEDIVTALDYMEADMYEGFLAQKYLGIDLRATSHTQTGSSTRPPAGEPGKPAGGMVPPSPPFRVSHDPKPGEPPSTAGGAKPPKKNNIHLDEYGEIIPDEEPASDEGTVTGSSAIFSPTIPESPTPGLKGTTGPAESSAKTGTAGSTKSTGTPGSHSTRRGDSPSSSSSSSSAPSPSPSSTPAPSPTSTSSSSSSPSPSSSVSASPSTSSSSQPSASTRTSGSDGSVNWADVSRKMSPGRNGNGLLILLAVVAVALIGVLIYLLSTSGEDAGADTAAIRTPGTELALPSDTTMAPAAPDPALLAAALPDTLVLTIYAARGNLEPVRILSDVFNNIQRPYWVEAGKAMQFEFVQEIQIRGNLERMIILYDGRMITDFDTFDSRNRLIRISREQFLRDPTLGSFTTGSLPEGLPGPSEIMERPRF
jgi:hypothetical protein